MGIFDPIEKTDKLIVLYDKAATVRMDVVVSLLDAKIKPSFILVPTCNCNDENMQMGMLYFTLGTILPGISGTAILLGSADEYKQFDGFSYGAGKIKVCSSMKEALAVKDPSVKPRKPRMPKKSDQVMDNPDEKKLLDRFLGILDECSTPDLHIKDYSSAVLVSVQEATDEEIGLNVKLAVNIGREMGDAIHAAIKHRFRELQDIARQINFD